MNLAAFSKLFVLVFTTLNAASSFEFFERVTSDNVRIRVGHFIRQSTGQAAPVSLSDADVPVRMDARKVMFIFPGRVSRIERHQFLAEQLASLNFDVWVLDFRGQGGSQRLVENQQMVHVDDFEHYLRDVDALVNWDRFRDTRKFGYGHSMGGQVLLRFMSLNPHFFEAAVLESPMIRIRTAPIPYWLAEPLAWLMVTIRKGRAYCLGKTDYDPRRESHEFNRNCRDRDLFMQHFHVPETDRFLIPVGPSWGWVRAALQSMRLLLRDMPAIRAINTRVFLATAGDDRVLDVSKDLIIAQALLAEHRIFSGAWHTLLHDTPEVRGELLGAIRTFLSSKL